MRLPTLLASLLVVSPVLGAESWSFHLDPAAGLGDVVEDAPTGAETSIELDVPAAPRPFGSHGTRRWYLRLGGGVDLTDVDSSVYWGGVGYRHFVADQLSLDFELNAMGVVQDADNTAGLQASFTLSWHFICTEEWSLALESGIGILGSTDHIPDDGSAFNFTPHVGLGYTRKLDGDRRLQAGVRWLHISNANTFEDNPGVDTIVGYLGVSFGF